MDGLTIFIFLIFFGAVFLGVPIVFSLALGALIPMYFFVDFNMVAIVQKFFVGIDMFSFMAIPLFIFCGSLLEKSGVSRRLCDFVTSLVGWMPGGVAIVTFVTCMFFGAISGSATATVLAIGSIMVPVMIEENYDEKFALSCIAIGGILGSIIPPSIPMVVYGMAADTSISDLFMGGIIPGVILTFGFSLYAFYYGKKHVTNYTPFVLKRVWITFKDAIWGLMMPFIILGGIYGGVFTPTEAAGVASVYGIIVGFFVYRQLTLSSFYSCLKESVVSGSMIMFIVAAAAAYGYVMTRQQIPLKITHWLIGLTTSPLVFILIVIGFLLVLGTFMETCASILIVTPIFVPICKKLGIDLVAFGVIVVMTLAVGFVTPPLGLNLYVAAQLGGRAVDYVINKHLMVLIAIAVMVILIISFVPELILFLPNLLKP